MLDTHCDYRSIWLRRRFLVLTCAHIPSSLSTSAHVTSRSRKQSVMEFLKHRHGDDVVEDLRYSHGRMDVSWRRSLEAKALDKVSVCCPCSIDFLISTAFLNAGVVILFASGLTGPQP